LPFRPCDSEALPLPLPPPPPLLLLLLLDFRLPSPT